MKISYNWLKEYINTDLPSSDELAHLLTFCGLEVESVEPYESIKGGLNGLVTGKVISKEKHPDADKLSLVTVDVGQAELLNIVCGAPNVDKGQKVVVALVGAKLYPTNGEPFVIKKSKIRGAVSEGMICAEDEIGLGTSHEGIMVLPEDTPVGMPAGEYFKIITDSIFEIGLTPNRVDAASHIGVARDIAAVLAHQSQKEIALQLPNTEDLIIPDKKPEVVVEVPNNEYCARYSGITIHNVTVGESPDWLKSRLKAVGLNPINNIVDITNYVLLEYGQPLHAFDLAMIKGNKIVVKKQESNQKFVTLDGIERETTSADLMICNAEEPMCIAGVYGGLNSGINNNTTAIFLESAHFNAGSIRKTAKHHNLKTDASFRFERGTDPDATIPALKRAALLIMRLAGGTVNSNIVDIYPKKINPVEIKLNLKRCAVLIGKEIPVSQITHILKHLGIVIKEQSEDSLLIQIPLNKVDVLREADVIEEILRIYGYNNVEVPEQMRISLINKPKVNIEKINYAIRNQLTGMGFHEIMNNSLTASSYAGKFLNYTSEKIVGLLNPLSSELDSLRASMLFGMLQSINYNNNRKNNRLKLFESGKVYHKADGQFMESEMLAISISGNQNPESWNINEEKENIYRLKGVLEALFTRLGISPVFSVLSENSLVSGGLQIELNKTNIGYIGKVSNTLLKAFDINHEVFYAEIVLDHIYKPVSNYKTEYTEVPKFPEVRRDLALVLNENISFEQVVQVARKTEKNLIKDINLFDSYQGKNMEPSMKSYAISFTLLDTKATLTDKQIDHTMSKLIKAYEEELGATLRK